MEDMILNINTLPELLYRRFRSDRVRVHEDNGVVTLTPIDATESVDLWGLLADGKFTTDKYLAQKRQDKDLES